MAKEFTDQNMARLDIQAVGEAHSWLEFWEERFDFYDRIDSPKSRLSAARLYLAMAEVCGAWG